MATPVVFVHGLWLHADSWGAWTERFAGEGYAPIAPGWPGDGATVEETRANPAGVAGHGIEDVVQHYARVIDGLDGKPIIIGHSFGGLIAQRLLAEGHAVAGVAIDAAPIKGVMFLPPSAFRVASNALRNPANYKGAVALTRAQFRYGFGNAVSQEESDELFERWMIPSPGKPLFEAALAGIAPHSPAKVDTRNSARGPLLLATGTADHTVPTVVTKQTRRLYRKSTAVTDYKEFAGRGHSLCMDRGWADVAGATLDWLKQQSL
jgi:pimeloyl-ACP methyl ester carboxylesterase